MDGDNEPVLGPESWCAGASCARPTQGRFDGNRDVAHGQVVEHSRGDEIDGDDNQRGACSRATISYYDTSKFMALGVDAFLWGAVTVEIVRVPQKESAGMV